MRKRKCRAKLVLYKPEELTSANIDEIVEQLHKVLSRLSVDNEQGIGPTNLVRKYVTYYHV